jgi:hypothetical protein
MPPRSLQGPARRRDHHRIAWLAKLALPGVAALAGGCVAPIGDRATGIWDSPRCETLIGPGSIALHAKRHVALTATQSDLRIDYFDDELCTVATATVEITGAWSAGPEVAGMPGVFAADFAIEHVNVTSWIPRLSAYLMMMNCGSVTWNVGMTQETTSSGCFGIPPASMCSAIRTLIRVDGDQLWYGAQPSDGHAVCDPSARPTTLDGQSLTRSL